MLLIFHIIIALLSVAYTTYVFFSPSQNKVYIAYGLLILTILSGVALTLVTPASIIRACVSGLVYVGIMLVGLEAARSKLGKQVSLELRKKETNI